MKSFVEYRDKFKDFFIAVQSEYKNSINNNKGHGIDHDVTVAQFALIISPDDRMADMAWVASMLHSTDRLIGYESLEDENVLEDKIKNKVKELISFLPKEYFSKDEESEIFEAVMRHDEKNKEDQKLVQQVLQDADRLANLDLLLAIRCGQFRPNIKAIDFKYIHTIDPNSTFKEPKNNLDALRIIISEFVPQFRMPLAIDVAKQKEKNLLEYVEKIKQTYIDLGLDSLDLEAD